MPLEEEKPKKLDHDDARDMVSAIVGRIFKLQRPGSSQMSEGDDDSGTGIVTLAGNNIGATLKGEMDQKSGDSDDELDAMITHVNSNFQAVNNSIMMGGSYTTNDPGVHLEVCDFFEHRGKDHHKSEKHGKKEKKKKKKKKDQESGKSDEHTEHSAEDSK
ncbi:uncharacterized protein LOC104444145 [Eucalyptus grandis]|uniref:uncharacterized protein LOC104444145 n=1 Tax=Eucalyptus grandis TaxID=71139 RepID=UPI00192ED50A|nr:uncharacterized protein LOC104444145 [Eucalyptus grandis]